jgi:hypothetical protein
VDEFTAFASSWINGSFNSLSSKLPTSKKKAVARRLQSLKRERGRFKYWGVRVTGIHVSVIDAVANESFFK